MRALLVALGLAALAGVGVGLWGRAGAPGRDAARDAAPDALAPGAPPEAVALAYGRALYASDPEQLWPLIATADRRVKDRAAFARQLHVPRGFARDAVRWLAARVSAVPLRVEVAGDRATVTLRWRLPDANAPPVRELLLDWDEDRLDALPAAERARILGRLAALAERGALPVVEGDETFTLVREAGAWRVLLGWAEGVRVRFAVVTAPGLPLQVSVEPAEAVLAPGDRLRVTVRATSTAPQPVTARVEHRTEPAAHARHLALLLCPLFVPVTLAPGETREFASEYLLLADAPKTLRALAVTYALRPAP